MSEVLIMKIDLDPEVEVYMESEGVSLEKALRNLELETNEAVSTELEIVDKEDLDDYGIKGRNYLIIKRMSQLERYEYELEDVLNQFNIDIKRLKRLGVLVDENEDYEDD